MKDEILIISTLHQEIWMIWISLLDYYIDSHYSLLFESRVFKGLNIYWPSTVVILTSPLRVHWFLLRLPTALSFIQTTIGNMRQVLITPSSIHLQGHYWGYIFIFEELLRAYSSLGNFLVNPNSIRLSCISRSNWSRRAKQCYEY